MGGPSVPGMMIDCESCTVRGDACADCVVTFLTIPVRAERPVEVPARGDRPPAGAVAVDLDAAEQRAIGLLAQSGLVPPLRMVRVV